jgi:succinate dehydrogenase/fumarate reductase cytochrome b subunit
MTTDQVTPDTKPTPDAGEQPVQRTAPPRGWLKNLHRFNAILIGLFLLVHIANHLVALEGPAAHIRVMQWLRVAYRAPVLEVLLLAGVLGQAWSGVRLLLQRGAWRRKGVGRLQVVSGAYLALFIVIHLSAIAWARLVPQLDTNFYFAAAGLNLAPFPVFFVPYYFLAVVALFAHVACALHRLLHSRLTLRQRHTILAAWLGAGILAGALIVAAFSGLVHPLAIPAPYLATYG